MRNYDAGYKDGERAGEADGEKESNGLDRLAALMQKAQGVGH